MKVKIGDKYFDSKDQPIMIVLSDKEKSDIANMPAECTKYAIFPNTVAPLYDDFMTEEQMIEWMD